MRSAAIILVRFLVIVVIAFVCKGEAYDQFPDAAVGVDDANIFFVYGKNLAQGYGCVFNGGGERVEGFSSSLWMLVTFAATLMAGSPEIVLLVFSIVVVSIALTLLSLLVDRAVASVLDGGDTQRVPACSLFFVVLVAWTFASPGYICWTAVSLMETGVWSSLLITTAAVVAGVGRSARRSAGHRALFSGLVFLIVIGRPEGSLWALAFLAMGVLVSIRRTGEVKSGVKPVLIPLLVWVITMVGTTLFRMLYFGHPLPNTYYAKMSPDLGYNLREGWHYFSDFVSSNKFLGIFVVFSLICAVVLTVRLVLHAVKALRPDETRPEDRRGFLGAACFVVSAAVGVGMIVPILVGGDHFGSFRFYQPVWPLLPVPVFLCAVLLVRRTKIHSRLTERVRMAVALSQCILVVPAYFAFAAANSTTWKDLSPAKLRHEFRIAAIGRKAGAYMNKLFAATGLPRVGVIATGGVKYTYEGEIADLMGLNSTEMAHHKGDRYGIKNHAAFSKEVFYSIKPDIVVTPVFPLVPDGVRLDDYRRKFEGGVARKALKDLFRDGRFLEQYVLAAVRKSDKKGRRVCGYFRDEYLDVLRADAAYDVKVLEKRVP